MSVGPSSATTLPAPLSEIAASNSSLLMSSRTATGKLPTESVFSESFFPRNRPFANWTLSNRTRSRESSIQSALSSGSCLIQTMALPFQSSGNERSLASSLWRFALPSANRFATMTSCQSQSAPLGSRMKWRLVASMFLLATSTNLALHPSPVNITSCSSTTVSSAAIAWASRRPSHEHATIVRTPSSCESDVAEEASSSAAFPPHPEAYKKRKPTMMMSAHPKNQATLIFEDMTSSFFLASEQKQKAR